MADYHKRILDEVEKRCYDYCEELCRSAVSYRKSEPEKHDFTGNLLNSIAVCLYRDGNPKEAWYSQDIVFEATQAKMTAPRKYRFFNDYSGAKSRYNPDVKTDEGYGANDALNFFMSYRPAGRRAFDIVVAYTTEYADWVEQERGTTGIMRTYDFADRTAIQFLQLPRATGAVQ